MQDFTKIEAWKGAHALVLRVYRVTKDFPQEERYGVISQLRRAAVSVPTNIAEGARRKSRTDYAHFLNISESSLAEVRYLVLLSGDLGYLQKEEVAKIGAEATSVSKLLYALRTKVEEVEAGSDS